jgi:predicted DNA-binding transcriptional regulator AlpA
MTDRPDRAALLPPIEAVDALPAELLPGLLAGLAALQARAAARLTVQATADPAMLPPGADKLLDVREAAERISMSADWLYRHKDKLPFTRRVGTRTVRFSEAGITRWLASRAR